MKSSMKQTFDLLKITNTILCKLMMFKLSFISSEMTRTILNDIMLSVTLVPYFTARESCERATNTTHEKSRKTFGTRVVIGQYRYVEICKPSIILYWSIYFWEISIKFSRQVPRWSRNLIRHLISRFAIRNSLSVFDNTAHKVRFLSRHNCSFESCCCIYCLSQRNCKQFVLMFALFNLDL